MKIHFYVGLICLTVALSAVSSAAGEKDLLDEADSAYTCGSLDSLRKSIELYQQELISGSAGFDAVWKCSRAYWKYAETAKKQKAAEWKKTCAVYGKLGMRCAEKAIAVKPQCPEGYYYYALNAGIYADGVSMLTALLAGLKGNVQESLEKVYELDPMYDNAEAILGLGRFWAVVPWPFRDRQKALAYYREYQATEFFSQKDEARLYLAELLMEKDGEENISEARELLRSILSSRDKSICQQAQKLIEEIEP